MTPAEAEIAAIHAGELPGAWAERAACRGVHGLHYPLDGETPGEARTRTAAAVAICERCPVQSECLAYGLRTVWTDRHAVLGGLPWIARRDLVVAVKLHALGDALVTLAPADAKALRRRRRLVRAAVAVALAPADA